MSDRVALVTMVVTVTLGAGVAHAQHEGHQRDAPAPDQACAQAGPMALQITELAQKQLEAARQTNSAAAMRSAIADLQAALTELTTTLAPCRPAAGATMDHPAHGAPAAVTRQPVPPVDPAAPPGEIIDPVCGMTVDPKTAANAEHQGRMYYFCSEEDRQQFLKTPAKYIRKDDRW